MSTELVDDYISKVKNLRVIYLYGNDCVRKIPHYRKVMTIKCKELRYIDDKPIFEDERRFAEAFSRGGLDEERAEREKYRQEKKEESTRRVYEFQNLIKGWQNKRKEPSDQADPKGNENKEESKKEMLRKLNQERLRSTEEEGVMVNIQEAKEEELNDLSDMPNLEEVKSNRIDRIDAKQTSDIRDNTIFEELD